MAVFALAHGYSVMRACGRLTEDATRSQALIDNNNNNSYKGNTKAKAKAKRERENT